MRRRCVIYAVSTTQRTGYAVAAMSVRSRAVNAMKKKYIWVSSGGSLDGLVERGQ